MSYQSSVTYGNYGMAGRRKTKDAAESIAAAPSGVVIRVLRLVEEVLKGAGKPALIAALVLTVVWCVGRVMEALHGNAVFDMTLTYGLGTAIFILLAVWVIGSGTAAVEDLGKARNRTLAVVSWTFLAALVVTVLLSLEGYRTSATGLFASIAGSAETSSQTSFLLFKYHSLNPMLAVNLAASKLAGVSWDTASLAPYVWSWNALFAFFIWSLAYGILLLMHKDKLVGSKSVHLFLAAFGLLALIILKSVSQATTHLMIMFQATAAILLAFQALLAFACVRALAARVKEEDSEHDAFQVSTPEEKVAREKRFIGLPPSALKLALSLFIVLPIMADLQNQFMLSSSSARIVQKISMNQTGSAPQFEAVAPMSIRSGPATGDDILGILPKGTRVPVLDKKSDWVNIGENKWVPEKFLKPVGAR